MKYYVYCLMDPRSNYPFYVGKGTRDRSKQHFSEQEHNTTNKYKFRVISKIRQAGFEPTIMILERFNLESAAYEYEKYLISTVHGLTNIQPGGEGGCGNVLWKGSGNPSHQLKGRTYEDIYGAHRAAMYRKLRSDALTGRQFTDETKRKMSASAKKRDHTYKQRVVSTPDGEFSSISSAAKHYQLSVSAMSQRLTSDKWPGFRR